LQRRRDSAKTDARGARLGGTIYAQTVWRAPRPDWLAEVIGEFEFKKLPLPELVMRR
jgi:hypothetical protein